MSRTLHRFVIPRNLPVARIVGQLDRCLVVVISMCIILRRFVVRALAFLAGNDWVGD
jgi:hypothetical protein